MSQETRSPIDVAGEYWATYNPKKAPEIEVSPDVVIEAATYPWATLASDAHLDPWCNGRYALAALVWGLIALVVLGIGAGP